jgi:hypothetical protein
MLYDVVLAFHAVRRTPRFTLLAILTMGLGIGAATAVFSVAEAVLLRPLPYPEPDRLVDPRRRRGGHRGGAATGPVHDRRGVRRVARGARDSGRHGPRPGPGLDSGVRGPRALGVQRGPGAGAEGDVGGTRLFRGGTSGVTGL